MLQKIQQVVIVIIVLAIAVLLGVAPWFLSTHNVAVLAPAGPISAQQKDLMMQATLLMALVVVPVFALTFGIAWRYREGNHKATYSPNLHGNRLAETIWWLVPLAIITVLASMAWSSSHRLDPYQHLSSDVKPIRVQVVALQWRWLFIYPDEHIATINYINVPTNTPIDFELTADAPMNSFWVPQLGGQIYAMAGMRTQLHLAASHEGTFRGVSANISGKGFADMHFTVNAMSDDAYQNWLGGLKTTASPLTINDYTALAAPSADATPRTYTLTDASSNLFDVIMHKYSSHGDHHNAR